MKGNTKNRNYTIIVVSDATASNKEFYISSKLIRNFIVCAAVLLGIFGFIIFDFLTISLDKQKMKRLERENIEKEKTIIAQAKAIQQTNESLRNMYLYREKIKVAVGLTSPLALQDVGQGGPAYFPNPGGTPTLPAKPLPGGNAVVPPVDQSKRIVESAHQLENSLKDIEVNITQFRARLSATPAIWPCRGIISAAYGNRVHPFTGKWEMHSAIDIATQLGNRVTATADGVVIMAQYHNYLGNVVVIDHGFGFTTRYGHLSEFKVKEGQRVKRYDAIGMIGNTGRSTAPHLHYEVRYMDQPLNPYNYMLD